MEYYIIYNRYNGLNIAVYMSANLDDINKYMIDNSNDQCFVRTITFEKIKKTLDNIIWIVVHFLVSD